MSVQTLKCQINQKCKKMSISIKNVKCHDILKTIMIFTSPGFGPKSETRLQTFTDILRTFAQASERLLSVD